jgi:hypothetical protein
MGNIAVHDEWDETAELKGRPTIAALLRMEAEAHDNHDINLMSHDRKEDTDAELRHAHRDQGC